MAEPRFNPFAHVQKEDSHEWLQDWHKSLDDETGETEGDSALRREYSNTLKDSKSARSVAECLLVELGLDDDEIRAWAATPDDYPGQAQHQAVLAATRNAVAKGEIQRGMERLFGRIHKLLADQKYDECDALLATFEAKLFPPMFAVGVLRASFPVRKKLPSWEQVLGETREYLKAEGMNASHALRGLE